ncbi:hypothetical protein DES53_102959 [Roseimicrobium gellanilyticum]|uniref:Uncharacterized protein n=1 Tax=Roseimicrobium gellanilyticum TaxID=748857 RepID=A0A366HU02_9BACT|nr:hypothetical protein [Roseimicrobium gellanilyticum]RBP46568.1 hypothetical protein DES53_102959 [Roseimicrobium gellanilyticum]
MNTYLQKRWSGSVTNPSESDMRTALAELSTHDPEHPDCWLSDENGWTISTNEAGTIVLENAETDEGPWHIPNSDTDMVLTLWKHLSAGEMELVRSHPWKSGYQP